MLWADNADPIALVPVHVVGELVTVHQVETLNVLLVRKLVASLRFDDGSTSNARLLGAAGSVVVHIRDDTVLRTLNGDGFSGANVCHHLTVGAALGLTRSIVHSFLENHLGSLQIHLSLPT